MIKILVKAFILVCIILSIYFIVNPSACSNLINGRAVNSKEEIPTILPDDNKNQEMLTPAGDNQPLVQEESAPAQTTATPSAEEPTPVVTDTNSTQTQEEPAKQASTFTQADIDYAIASRYVELENEYLAKKQDTKNAAKEISYIVMDDFELTPAEWEAFLQRATTDNLFEKVRQQQAAK